MLRVVYADVLAGINFLINYLMLFAAAKLCGVRINRPRMMAGAAAGAIYCCMAYFWDMPFLWAAAAKLLMGGAMAAIAFGVNKSFIRIFLTFCAVTFAFGGGVMAAALITGGMGRVIDVRNGVWYIKIPAGVLILTSLICFAAMNIVFKRKAMGRQISKIELTDSRGSLSFAALVDTGNSLTDPITNQPVVVVEYNTLRAFLPENVTAILDSANPETFPMQIHRLPRDMKFRLLPYKTVGCGLDMLLIFRPRLLTVDNRRLKGGFVGISPHPISDGGGYSGIIGA